MALGSACHTRSSMSSRALAEEENKPIALAWIDAALAALRDRSDDDVTRSALEINFRVHRSVDDPVTMLAIFGIFVLARAIIVRSDKRFCDVSEERAKAIFGEGI